MTQYEIEETLLDIHNQLYQAAKVMEKHGLPKSQEIKKAVALIAGSIRSVRIIPA